MKRLFFILLLLLLPGIGIFQAFHLPAGPATNQNPASVEIASPQPVTGAADLVSTGPLASTAASPTPTAALAATRPAPGLSGPQAAARTSPTSRPAPTQVPSQQPYQPVKVETLAIFAQAMGDQERVAQVYLPGEYAQNPTKRYPVLYAFDGQQLPQISFEQNLNELIASSQIQPLIVVAVFSTEGDLRREELGAGPAINFLGWGTQSDAFNQFVVSELVPKVNSAYRTLPGAQHTGIMGWSLGGLAAFYLAWQNPDVFGLVGAFSPSFWWRTDSLPGQELQARVIPNLVSASPKRPGLRMWFEAGTAELPFSDVDHNGVIDMIQDVQDTMSLLAQKGYQANVDMVYRQVEGGQHELSTWETVMPEFLRFAYGVK